jgi:hypothetical protein
VLLQRAMFAFLIRILLALRSVFEARAGREAEILVLRRSCAKLVILRQTRRRLVRIAITRKPTAEWIAGQVTEAFPWDEAPRQLIRDRDCAFGQ